MLPVFNNSICPVCHAETIQPVMECRDHSITKEDFTIWQCTRCTARFTRPVPQQQNLARYYEAAHYISHSDTSEGVIAKLYKLVREITLSEKRRVVQRISDLTAGTLLDIGSGTGAFAAEMATSGWKVTGLEPDAGARAKAKELYKLDLKPAETLYHLPDAAFDVITLWHVLEHVFDLDGYFANMHRILKPGGAVFIGVPNYTSPDGQHYGTYWAAYDVPRHLYHFSPQSMAMLAGRHAFRLVARRAMWFDAFYIALLSEQYKHGRQRFLAALWVGVRCTFATLFNRTRASSIMYILKKQ
ncbi:MAG: class I SAM-dependent methyltransferase [Chitinophagaceae bacterium]|nr:class I SAM-dependent methyltransferase [Chitinophagaceae bacterium]